MIVNFRKFMVGMPHRLQCKILYFPKHTFPIHATRNAQTHLKSTVPHCSILCFSEQLSREQEAQAMDIGQKCSDNNRL